MLFVLANCKKETPATGSGSVLINPPPPPTNTPPKAHSGSDQLVFLPANSCLLLGSASDNENNIKTILWEKISGPNSFLFEYNSLLPVQIKNLVQGVYQFKLTVTDLYGLNDQDTTMVIVSQISNPPTEIIINNLTWGSEGFNGPLLWGSTIMIPNIYQYLPAGRIFRIFFRKANSTFWEELFIGDNALYLVYLINGTLGIWSGADETESVSIKLIY